MLTVKDVRSNYPAKIPHTAYNIFLAKSALDLLWQERCGERGELYVSDRSGSCKFAALLSRILFGGRLAGNNEHVFTVNQSTIIDLNVEQLDVVELGRMAHVRFDNVLTHKDYREALSSCIPRVEKWEKWVMDNLNR